MDSSTQVVRVLDALVTSMTAALGGSVHVVDGPPFESDLTYPDVLVVGFSPARAAVEIGQERQGLSRDHRAEVASVVCLVSAKTGATDVTAVEDCRTRVVELLDLVRGALADDRTLGGRVRRAVLGPEMALDYGNESGIDATLEFTVEVVTL